MNRSFRWLAALCLILTVTACSPDPTAPVQKNIPQEGFGGIWVMNLGQKIFVVLILEKDGEAFAGTLTRPKDFQLTNGRRFSKLSPEIATETVNGTIQGNRLHFVTRNTRGKEDESEYDMTLTGANSASLTINDTPIEPWPLTRAEGTALPVVSSDWEPQRSYSLDDNAVSNSEMQRIYDEDQRGRQNNAQFAAENETVSRQDEERRSQTRKLLADGQLHTAEDFKRAAFIFQHGSKPDDFLLAHALAMVAAAKGDEDALWIGTATLDRYLHSTGKPQIFGTQIKEKADHTATLEPYNRSLIADVLRRELGVQPLTVQQEQLQQWTEQFKASAAERRK